MTQPVQDKIWLTQEAYDKLKAELENLSGPVRQEIIERISSARDEGDLKENGGYHAAKDEQGKVEARIRQLEDMLRRAEVGETPKDNGIVEPGMKVTYKFAGDDEENTFLLGNKALEDGTIDVFSPESPSAPPCWAPRSATRSATPHPPARPSTSRSSGRLPTRAEQPFAGRAGRAPALRWSSRATASEPVSRPVTECDGLDTLGRGRPHGSTTETHSQFAGRAGRAPASPCRDPVSGLRWSRHARPWPASRLDHRNAQPISLVEPSERQRARVETRSPSCDGLDTLGRGRPHGSTTETAQPISLVEPGEPQGEPEAPMSSGVC